MCFIPFGLLSTDWLLAHPFASHSIDELLPQSQSMRQLVAPLSHRAHIRHRRNSFSKSILVARFNFHRTFLSLPICEGDDRRKPPQQERDTFAACIWSTSTLFVRRQFALKWLREKKSNRVYNRYYDMPCIVADQIRKLSRPDWEWGIWSRDDVGWISNGLPNITDSCLLPR